MVENKMLRRIFVPKRQAVMTAGRRQLHNEEVHNFYSSSDITIYLSIYLSMALLSFYWTLVAFSVS
jgi:hypothetical protein